MDFENLGLNRQINRQALDEDNDMSTNTTIDNHSFTPNKLDEARREIRHKVRRGTDIKDGNT